MKIKVIGLLWCQGNLTMAALTSFEAKTEANRSPQSHNIEE